MPLANSYTFNLVLESETIVLRVRDQLVPEPGTSWSQSKGPVDHRVRDQLVSKWKRTIRSLNHEPLDSRVRDHLVPESRTSWSHRQRSVGSWVRYQLVTDPETSYGPWVMNELVFESGTSWSQNQGSFSSTIRKGQLVPESGNSWFQSQGPLGLRRVQLVLRSDIS